MNTVAQYDRVCQAASDQVVQAYSSSFSLGIRSLDHRFRAPIRAIYGFVRLADEIVDTFHGHDKRALLERFATDVDRAIAEGISLNPVLHSFQHAARIYGIDGTLIAPFLESMRTDLDRKTHDPASFQAYVFGSAEVVGLMCLRVFCEGDATRYHRLGPAARRLGAAFQKVNFLRDLTDDARALGRTYFPDVDPVRLSGADKRRLEADIEEDLQAALIGIRELPNGARFGVYMAYAYYRALFRKIRMTSVERLMGERIRLPDRRKITLLTAGYLRHNFGRI